MLKIALFLMTIVVTSSCGGFKLFSPKTPEVDRKIASLMINDEDQTFIEALEEKLMALHSYYVIGQKSLLELDRDLPSLSLREIQLSKAYLNLEAVKNQVEAIEADVLLLYEKGGKKELLKSTIQAFSKRSVLSRLSMENLAEKFSVKIDRVKGTVTFSEIAKEYRDLELIREFQVFDKNIEHLSHLFLMKKKPLFQSENLRASALPAKVWALSFTSQNTSPIILQKLKEKNIKATFLKTKTPEIDQSIRDAVITWNIDALDWMAQTPDRIIKRTILMMNKTSRDSGVILFHDIHTRGAVASAEVMNHLRANNRRICTLSEIAKDMNESSEKVCLNN